VAIDHLSPELSLPADTNHPTTVATSRPSLGDGQTLAMLVDDIERDLIRQTLSSHRGNISESARALGLTRRGLYLKLRRLGLEGPSN
jgi:DNA-binding NtrC family response regulator